MTKIKPMPPARIFGATNANPPIANIIRVTKESGSVKYPSTADAMTIRKP